MVNVVALVKDDRVRRSIELWLGELDMDVHFATFKTQAEFQQLYFREGEPEVSEEEPTEEGAELKLFSEIHLLIFAIDAIEGKSSPWIDRTRAALTKFKLLPASGTRMVLLKYEDDNVSKLDVLHPHLDDLIYEPIDRLIFLQKMQIFLNLPKLTSPTFLFNQEVKQTIEISKIAKLERFSDVGLAIRNPLPLKRGLPGHFHITLPGEKQRLEILGKVLRSEPDPERPGQYLTYFSYFGLSKSALSAIRRALSKSPQYRSLLFDDRARFKYQPDDLFIADEERHVFGVMVIDTDEGHGTSVAQTLTKEMDRLSVATESSFQVFQHRYLEAGGASGDRTPPRASDAGDFYANPITMTVHAKDLKCMSVDPGPLSDSTFLGHPALIIFASPDKWLSLVQEKESRLIMEEAAQLAERGRVLEKLLAFQDALNQRVAVNLRIWKGEADGTVAIALKPASLADIVEKLQSDQRSKELEVALLDTSFVPDDPTAWLEAIQQRAKAVGLTPMSSHLKVWLLSDGERVSPGWLNSPEVLGMFVKPVDHRQLLFSMSEHLPNKNTVFRFDNLVWTSPGLNVHVAKEIDLEALSEFGATLSSKQRLVPGTMIYLRKSIYDNAPNGCLAARVYACQEHPSDKTRYQVFVTYFGINDAFLKFARTWIRENYAHQKQQ